MSHTATSSGKKESTLTITISEEYAGMIPQISGEDYEKLKESIKKEGMHIPIIVNQNGILLDGHHRFKICQELGIKPKVVTKTFEDRIQEELFVIDINLLRRHLTDYQRGVLVLKKKPLLEELAKRNEQLGGKEKGFTNIGKPLHVQEQLAEEAGVSKGQLYKIEQISNSENLTEEIEQKLETGDMSVDRAYKQVVLKPENEKREKQPLPTGQFDVILADPPWKYDVNLRGNPDEHYGIMEDEQIEQMKVPSADKAILFLWATAPKIKDALIVMEKWGFEYKTNMTWVKNKIGLGTWVRGKHEHLLIGIKGKFPTPDESVRPPSVFEEPSTEHSKKPTIVYEIIEKMYPKGTYLELFSRGQRWSESWTTWGDEAQ